MLMVVEKIDWAWDSIDQLLDDDPDQEVLEEFLRHPDTRRLLAVTTRSICRRWGVDLARHGEDFHAECSILLLALLTDPAARASARRVNNGLAVALSLKFSNLVRQILESAEWNGSSGLSTRIRRQRALAKHEAWMAAQTGQTPTSKEVVESFNEQMTAKRADAARQGMLATESDLEPIDPVQLDPTLDVPAAGHDDDFPLMSVDARPVLEAIIVRASAEGGMLAQVVRAWLDHFDATPPYIATIAEIVDAVGLPEVVVRELKAQATVLARQVLAEDFGIEHATW